MYPTATAVGSREKTGTPVIRVNYMSHCLAEIFPERFLGTNWINVGMKESFEVWHSDSVRLLLLLVGSGLETGGRNCVGRNSAPPKTSSSVNCDGSTE